MCRIHMHKHASERKEKKLILFRCADVGRYKYFLNVEHENQAEQTLDNESLAEWWNDGDNIYVYVRQESMILAMVNAWE